MKPTDALYIPDSSSISVMRSEFRLLGETMVLEVLYTLDSDGEAGFNAIKARLGMTSSPGLSRGLKKLESSGMVARRVTGASPPRVYYSLTQKGREFMNHLQSIVEWSGRWDNAEKSRVEVKIDTGKR